MSSIILYLTVIVINIKQLPPLFRGEPREAINFALGAWQLPGLHCELTCPSSPRSCPRPTCDQSVCVVSLFLALQATQKPPQCTEMRAPNCTNAKAKERIS